ncbi:hypothetical protein Tco_0427946, partial [Tanacetum coccineum]
SHCVMNAPVLKPNIPSNNIVAPNMEQVDGFTMVKMYVGSLPKDKSKEVSTSKQPAVVGSLVKTGSPGPIMTSSLNVPTLVDLGKKVNEVQKVNESTPSIARPMVNKHSSSLSLNVEEDSESELEHVYGESETFMTFKSNVSGSEHGTNSLYEQWKDTLDDDYDAFDDDV